MVLSCDFHLHSQFSADSETPMEQQVQAAIKAGLSSICFTEHIDPDWPYDNTPKEELSSPFTVDMPSYENEVKRLRGIYGDRIRIGTGIEMGLAPGYEEMAEDFVRSHEELDFVIGSVHSLDHKDLYFPDFFAGFSVQERVSSYFSHTWEMAERCSFFQTLGHMDYILRYAIRQEDPDFLSYLSSRGITYGSYCFSKNRHAIEKILSILIKRGQALEINTQAIAKAAAADPNDLAVFRETNPGRDTLLLYKSLGGKFLTTGSDAHVPDGVGKGFSEAAELILSCGFSGTFRYEHREPIFVPL
ncbi:MAG: histidinol-phosphatase HisJ family protein [Lachnospiraceae bacterium]